MRKRALLLLVAALSCASAQEMHHHPAPEKLGTVSFPTSCRPAVQASFERAVALLHSFAYEAADQAFRDVAAADPHCAIAHWGSAMTHYHQLWDLPPSAADSAAAQQQIAQAQALGGGSEREQQYLHALSLIFVADASTAYSERALRYETAMQKLAAAQPSDVEAQVFYSLALISNASPRDKTHRRQKQAVDQLDPLFRQYPDHPGLAHYLIHACDNQEMAQRGLPAARAYAAIAPAAPHALHMPSHIFTRLGLWQDSIKSNIAARDAASQNGDTGEELHAMDYLMYAYLQSGRDQEAAQVLQQLKAAQHLRLGEFKSGYAATAMPVRYIVERSDWQAAQAVVDPPDAALPHVQAITVWARGLGFARSGHPEQADLEAAKLEKLEERLVSSSNTYWASQVSIMRREIAAWSAQAKHQPDQASTLMRSAADDEDAVEKLPVTPGPIIPAREQLGQLLLQQGQKGLALQAFQTALVSAPGRRGALEGLAEAASTPREQASSQGGGRLP